MDDTRFRYYRDPENPNRVVTIGTQKDGDTIRFAMSVNHPPEWKVKMGPHYYAEYRKPGDYFSKKKAKELVRTRLGYSKVHEVTVDTESGQKVENALYEYVKGLPETPEFVVRAMEYTILKRAQKLYKTTVTLL